MNPYLVAYLKSEVTEIVTDGPRLIDTIRFAVLHCYAKLNQHFKLQWHNADRILPIRIAFPHNFEDKRVPIYCILYGLCSFWLVDCSRKYCRWIWNTFSFLHNVDVKNNTNKIFRYLWSCENLHSTDNKIDRIFANASISKKVWSLKK